MTSGKISIEKLAVSPTLSDPASHQNGTGSLWAQLDQFEDRLVFQTRPWLEFLQRTQGAEPVVAVVKEHGQPVGYFTGLIVKKFGVKILGSPFKGWATDYMGFNLPPGMPRRSVLQALDEFAFERLGCHYVEIIDRHTRQTDYTNLGYTVQFPQSYEIDLTPSEDQLFATMRSSCRRCIRKAKKSGVIIEEAVDWAFAADYYAQLQDVFAKQKLVPTYSLRRVRELIRCLQPAGCLLLLRARNAEGHCIATGIFPAFNKTAYFWGGASWRAHQILRPNEAIMWHAMRYWKARGMEILDMGGAGDYKKKYGGYPIYIPRLLKARYDFLIPMRNAAKQTWVAYQKIAGLWHR